MPLWMDCFNVFKKLYSGILEGFQTPLLNTIIFELDFVFVSTDQVFFIIKICVDYYLITV